MQAQNSHHYLAGAACPLCGHQPEEELLPLKALAHRSGYSAKRLREFCKLKVNPLPHVQRGQGKILVSWYAFRRWMNGTQGGASLSHRDRDILRELDTLIRRTS